MDTSIELVTRRAAAALAAWFALTSAASRIETQEPFEDCLFEEPAAQYHDLAETAAVLRGWIDAGGPWVRSLDLGASRGGRVLPAIVFGRPGEVPLDERPTMFLLGGLDGVSFSGSEATLRAAHALLSASEMRNDVAFVAIPQASPDGLAAALNTDRFDGTNDGVLDSDRDGRVDEDGPDDIDGDGRVLEMLLEDPDGDWTFASDARFLAPARPGDAPRFRHLREGLDDDGDGRWNEDGAGGVRLADQFPHGWQPGSGPAPMSEPLARRFADEILRRRTIAVVCFQGNHGGVAVPRRVRGSGLDEKADGRADRVAYEGIAAAFETSTGRRDGRRLALDREAAAGSFLDWCDSVPGVVAVEIAPWGPGVGSRWPAPTDGADEALEPRLSRRDDGPRPSADDRRWARWLDDARGGMGFSPWHRIELGRGLRAYVGGWHARVFRNPPEADLGVALAGFGELAVDLANALPRLQLLRVDATRAGDLVTLSARVKNVGALPTGSTSAGRWHGAPTSEVELTLEIPVGARRLAGPRRVTIPILAGGEASERFEWLVLAPDGGSFFLRAESARCASAEREVRP